jgi:5S rRNA maturation endonuclease (ribonuclease M5)
VQRYEDGQWVWGRGKAPYTLYRLPRVAEAVAAGERVFLVEGEKDVDALERAGVAATTAPGGAGKVWRPEYSEALCGAYVTIVADRDEAGRKHARKAAEALADVAAEVVVVEPAVNRPHADASDHLAAGFGLDDFAPLSPALPSDEPATVQPVPAEPPVLAAEQRILDKFTHAVRTLGVVGEERTAAITYLVLTSRLLERQASLAVKGHSSSGKSFTVEQTVRFFPPEAVVVMTAMSERALVYSTEEYTHRTLVLYEATALREGVEDNLTAYFVRSLLSEGRIEYPVTVRDKDGNFTTKTIVKQGPTNLVVTTTKVQVHAENETRVLSITTDDSRDQTARVLAALADETDRAVDLDEWVALQRWLAAHGERRVTIPYARRLASLVPPVAVRLRRDFGTLLALVRAHAILHQLNRKRDPAGRVIASLDDYEAVRDLVEDVIAEGVAATVSPTIRSTILAVQVLTEGEAPPYPDGAMVKAIADELLLDKSAAYRRIQAAAAAGYIANDEDRRGRPGRWRVADALPVATGLLPGRDQLQAALDDEAAGRADDDPSGCTVAGPSEGRGNEPGLFDDPRRAP